MQVSGEQCLICTVFWGKVSVHLNSLSLKLLLAAWKGSPSQGCLYVAWFCLPWSPRKPAQTLKRERPRIDYDPWLGQRGSGRCAELAHPLSYVPWIQGKNICLYYAKKSFPLPLGRYTQDFAFERCRQEKKDLFPIWAEITLNTRGSATGAIDLENG